MVTKLSCLVHYTCVVWQANLLCMSVLNITTIENFTQKYIVIFDITDEFGYVSVIITILEIHNKYGSRFTSSMN